MAGKRCARAAFAAVLMLVLVVWASSARVAPSAGAQIAAADCSEATATQLINDNKLNGFLLPDPVVQLLCGPFAGPGSQAMVATIGAGTCWSPQSWALFDYDGSSWKLVHFQPAFLLGPLVVVGGTDLRETTPIFRSGDPRCVPSGGSHARVWHWDGSRLVAGAWKRVSKGKAAAKRKRSTTRTGATFYSPSRNISCEMNDGRAGGSYVYCQSWKRPQSVKMGLDGRLKVCHDASVTTTHCLGNPGEGTPVLGYGKQVSLKHFRCRSAQAGVTCTAIKTGKGFRISRSGVKRVG